MKERTYIFKLTDLVLQCLAIGLPLIKGLPWMSLLCISIIQPFSCLVNYCFLPWQHKHKFRQYYAILLACMLVVMLFATMVSKSGLYEASYIIQFMAFGVAMIFVLTALAMMLMYLWLTFKELQHIDEVQYRSR